MYFLFQFIFFFFQAEDGIRDRSPSRGLGDVYKRQDLFGDEYIDNNLVFCSSNGRPMESQVINRAFNKLIKENGLPHVCLLYTSDAADEEDSVELGGRRIIKKKKNIKKKKDTTAVR